MNILSDCVENSVNTKNFIDKVKDFVQEGACRLDDLCDAEKRELTGILITALNDPFEWIYESKKRNETLQNIINVMAFSHYEDVSKDELVESIQDQAVDFFSKRLNEYIMRISETYLES